MRMCNAKSGEFECWCALGLHHGGILLPNIWRSGYTVYLSLTKLCFLRCFSLAHQVGTCSPKMHLGSNHVACWAGAVRGIVVRFQHDWYSTSLRTIIFAGCKILKVVGMSSTMPMDRVGLYIRRQGQTCTLSNTFACEQRSWAQEMHTVSLHQGTQTHSCVVPFKIISSPFKK